MSPTDPATDDGTAGPLDRRRGHRRRLPASGRRVRPGTGALAVSLTRDWFAARDPPRGGPRANSAPSTDQRDVERINAEAEAACHGEDTSELAARHETRAGRRPRRRRARRGRRSPGQRARRPGGLGGHPRDRRRRRRRPGDGGPGQRVLRRRPAPGHRPLDPAPRTGATRVRRGRDRTRACSVRRRRSRTLTPPPGTPARASDPTGRLSPAARSRRWPAREKRRRGGRGDDPGRCAGGGRGGAVHLRSPRGPGRPRRTRRPLG